MRSRPELNPTCPRCGYDLRGTVATWEDGGACPLDGTCTECGLTFCWADVFDPTREEPQWCVEYAPGRPWPMAQAMVGTFARSWLPWVFWRRLRLHHEVRLRRIAVYLAVLLVVPTVVMYLLAQSAAAIVVRQQVAAALSTARVPANIAWTRQALAQWQTYERYDEIPEEDRYGALLWVEDELEAEDLSEVTLSQEQWHALWRRRADHIESMLESYQRFLDNPPQVQMTYTRAVAEAVFTPWSSRSSGTIVAPGPYSESGTIMFASYLAPRDLWQEVLLRASGVQWYIGPWHAVAHEAWLALIATIAWLMLIISYPLTFILLPITRRKAKVRARHFGRVTAYSISIPIVLLQLTVVVVLGSLFMPNIGHLIRGLATFVPILAPAPLLVAWWYCAIRWHLRLPHPMAVTVVMAALNAVVMIVPIAIMIGLIANWLDISI